MVRPAKTSVTTKKWFRFAAIASFAREHWTLVHATEANGGIAVKMTRSFQREMLGMIPGAHRDLHVEAAGDAWYVSESETWRS